MNDPLKDFASVKNGWIMEILERLRGYEEEFGCGNIRTYINWYTPDDLNVY